MDEAVERIFLRFHGIKHGSTDKVHPLAVINFGIKRSVGVQHVKKWILAGGMVDFEGLISNLRPHKVLLESILNIFVVLILIKFEELK